jgi:hypothetical protein
VGISQHPRREFQWFKTFRCVLESNLPDDHLDHPELEEAVKKGTSTVVALRSAGRVSIQDGRAELQAEWFSSSFAFLAR